MSEQPKALRLADWMQNAVQTYPQMSEDEPGGYNTEVDQVMDEAAAQLRRLHALCEESQTVVRDLLNALPSATTHPAIIAARTLAAKLESEQ